jgi:hypothetical protein
MRFRRRRFIQAGAALAAAPFCRAGEEEKTTLEADRQGVLCAAAERILPGVVEAGFAEYMKYWLSREPFSRAADWRPLLVAGAAQLQARSRQNYGRDFTHLAGEEQDKILEQFQQGKASSGKFRSDLFFQRLVLLALESFFSDPVYGGNKDEVGWRFAGHHHCWWAPGR